MIGLMVCHAIALILLTAVSFQIGRTTESLVWRVTWLMISLLGLTQAIYVVPLCIWLRRKRRLATLKGILLAAVLTLLVNGSCFLLPGMTYFLHI